MIEDENMPFNTGIAGDFEGYKKGVLGKAFFKDKEGRYQSVSVEDVQLPEQAASSSCEHHWVSRSTPKGFPINWVITCSQCREVNWAELREEIVKWGWAQRVSNDVNRAALASPVRELPLSAVPPIEVELNADEAVGKRLADGTCSKCTRPWDEAHEKRRAAYEKGVSEINALLPKEIPVQIHINQGPSHPGSGFGAPPTGVNPALIQEARRLQHEKWIQNG